MEKGSVPLNLWKRAPSPFLWRRAWLTRPGRQHRLRRPVISVGNLSMGGRGKTPLVAYLARLLVEVGERPAVLSRGYGRRRVEAGVVVVSDGAHLLADLDRSGDEPLMLARAAPGAAVLVCDERALAGSLAERALGATVHLLDDGFQHLALARDVDIVVIAPSDLTDRPMPFGRLREPIAALEAAHAVVIDSGEAGIERSSVLPVSVGNGRPVFGLERSLRALEPLEPERPWPPENGPIVALAGIAQPDRFTRSLERAGWTVAQAIAFPDHHRFSRRDVAQVAETARAAGASAVVTTAKDAVRLLPLRPLPFLFASAPLDVSPAPADAFRSWILGKLQEARA